MRIEISNLRSEISNLRTTETGRDHSERRREMNSLVEHNDELSWLAFRYVAGELDAAEAVRFEARMLEDIAVCEAVARVALVCETTYAAFDSDSAKLQTIARPSSARRFGVRATVAAAAGVVALAALMVHQVATRTSEDLEVARLWTASAAATSADSLSVPNLDDGDGTLPETSQAHDLDVPEWMLAAVRLEASDDDEVMDN